MMSGPKLRAVILVTMLDRCNLATLQREVEICATFDELILVLAMGFWGFTDLAKSIVG